FGGCVRDAGAHGAAVDRRVRARSGRPHPEGSGGGPDQGGVGAHLIDSFPSLTELPAAPPAGCPDVARQFSVAHTVFVPDLCALRPLRPPLVPPHALPCRPGPGPPWLHAPGTT